MSSDVVFSAVQTFLNANFTTAPLTYENDPPFQMPDPPAPWVLVEIYGSTFNQISMGSGIPKLDNKWREEGAVLAHVMVPVNSGSLVARQIATTLAGLFQGLSLSPDIRFADLSIGAGMIQSEDGNWWPLSVQASWARG